jgi:hypothetical protein
MSDSKQIFELGENAIKHASIDYIKKKFGQVVGPSQIKVIVDHQQGDRPGESDTFRVRVKAEVPEPDLSR